MDSSSKSPAYSFICIFLKLTAAGGCYLSPLAAKAFYAARFWPYATNVVCSKSMAHVLLELRSQHKPEA
jgi:hypothetical protein